MKSPLNLKINMNKKLKYILGICLSLCFPSLGAQTVIDEIIATVADNLIENVKYKVEELTGIEVNHINIYVEGVRVID